MKLTKSQRQAHANTFSDCIPVVRKRNTTNGKAGEYTKPRLGIAKAKEMLAEYHNIESFSGSKVHTCHLCKNDSTAPKGFVCKNPEHLYFGTPTENHYDKTPNARAKGGSIGGKHKSPKGGKRGGPAASKKALANGNHMSQQKRTCIYCGFESTPGMIGRWHNERCKHKP